MKRRSTVIKQLRDNIEWLLESAGIDQHLGDSLSEAYRRGRIDGTANALAYLLEDDHDARNISEAQRQRFLELKDKVVEVRS